jgi:hypothetical protein
MNFLEKDLEGIIFDSFGCLRVKESLINRGLEFLDSEDRYLYCKRQLNIKGAGIADLVFFQRNPYERDHIHFHVLELKRGAVDNKSVFQCNRYVEGISKYLESRGIKYTQSATVIGDRVSTNFRKTEIDNIGYIETMYYTYNFNGILFHKVKAD